MKKIIKKTKEKKKEEVSNQCSQCQGTGRHLPEQTCPDCQGTGTNG